MRKVSKLLHFIPFLGLLVGLSLLVWACGPAAPAVDEPTPAHALQPTAIPTVEPGQFTDPVAPRPAAPDESLQEPLVVLEGHELLGGEPFASAKPADGSDYEPSYKPAGGDTAIGEAKSDSMGGSVRKVSAQNREYTWQDGDRMLTVLLQDDLTVTGDGEIAPRDDTPVRTTRSETDGKVESPGLPVFRSPTGTLMTLPGGVLLALDESWSAAETDAFFEGNGVEQDRVSELEYLTNGFFVETDPGWASLDLANTLAEQDGVRISSPNWRREVVPK